MRLAPALLLFAVAVLPATGAAQDRPVVAIRARTAIVVDPIRRTPAGVEVTGRIQERITDEPVAYTEVVIRVDSEVVQTRSESDGTFRARFPVTEGEHRLRIEFGGEDYYSAAAFEIERFDVSKDPLTLVIDVEEEFPSTVKNVPVVVRAHVNSVPASIRAELYAGDASREALARVGVIVTNSNGRGEASFDRSSLGGAGRKRIEVRFPGNETLDPASTSTSTLFTSGTAINLEVADKQIRFEGSLRASGFLVDEFGQGVAGEPVSLVTGNKNLADALTGERGEFSFRVSASELGPGRISLQAVFDSSRAWLSSSRSEPVAAVIAEQQPVPVGYTLAAFGATAAALLAFVGMRTRPWEAWLARLRRSESEDQPHNRAGSDGGDKPVHTGLALARPGLVSTLRRASDFSFSGSVRNAVDARPIGGAEVRLSHPEHGEMTIETDDSGEFEFERVLAGEWNARVRSPGYVTERFGVSIPHRGELRNARIDLLPVREKIFAMYKDAASPMLPDLALWGIWTPRQIFDHVRRGRPARALSDLTDYVEEAYFSQRVPDEAALPEAARQVAAAVAEAAS